jgi:hypothetical protein
MPPWWTWRVKRASSSLARTPTCPPSRTNTRPTALAMWVRSSFASGAMLAQGAFRKAGLKKGDRAMVWGLLGQEGRGERTRGAVEKLKELGVQVDYLEISDEINADASLGAPVFSSLCDQPPGRQAGHHRPRSAHRHCGHLHEIRPQKGRRHLHRGIRPKPGHGGRHPPGLGRRGAGSAALAAGIHTHIPDLPDQEVWLFSGLHIDTGAAL